MEAISTITLLTLFAITIFIGYIGNVIFKKSRIPDVVWLILLGILIGPVFSLIDATIFIKLIPFLSAIALLIILFDAGLHMNIFRVIRDTPRSLALAISGIGISMVLVWTIAMIYFQTDPVTALILGAILGGTSSPIVLSLIKGTETEGRLKNLLTLESAATDAFTIIITLILINILIPSGSPALANILGSFSIGPMMGFLAGLAWLFVLNKVKQFRFSHMITLAALFMLYAVVEFSGGSGPLTALFFGIVIGNGKNVSTMLKLKTIFRIDPKIKLFQDEITFFIRSFFFVLLGMLASINPDAILLGIGISVLLILGRLLTAEIGMIKLYLPPVERRIIRIMTPRGLAAAVLAQLLLTQQEAIPLAGVFKDIIFVVILITVMYSSILTVIISRRIKNGEEKIKPGRRKRK